MGRAEVMRWVARCDPMHQEYTDLWVLHLADDRRVEDFEEWAYWPEKAYFAEPEA